MHFSKTSKSANRKSGKQMVYCVFPLSMLAGFILLPETRQSLPNLSLPYSLPLFLSIFDSL